ncbi:MAG: FAD-dependent oxidoreductase [Anaerolineae bacterium]|nr:FAD-dependent oxidoreductase [Anaerolineae bacterium]
MTSYRILKHPILPIPTRREIKIYWQDRELSAYEGETISAALFAAGIRVFGEHAHDHSPQGIFCANGQCSQCMLIANGKPVKACMELVSPDLRLAPLQGLPDLPPVAAGPLLYERKEIEVPVLILGGGPAGLSAAIELGKQGIKALLVDDKHRLGGKLVLQTHRFFGSSSAVYAGTRGIDIATRLEEELRQYDSIDIWTYSTALAVFSDKKVGILREGSQYALVKPQILLVTCGAREKFLAFKGNTLPGVYGAGAFQTLVNRDLVRPAEKLFIIGGGNVGLIAAYHALQAGIGVVGLAEALPECGGYKVHKDKLVRMGVPIYTSHTILSANGDDKVESVTIARVNEKFKPIPGSEASFECDSVLIAVGLDPVNEFYRKAVDFGMQAYVGGDAEEIAEASAAIFSGKIRGAEIVRALGGEMEEIPQAWYTTSQILKSRPGKTVCKEVIPQLPSGVTPVIHCTQEIPCNPCSALCPNGLIFVDSDDIRSIPTYTGDSEACQVCKRCVAGCPGLAITLVDFRKNARTPVVAIPYEFTREQIQRGDEVLVLDTEGTPLGSAEVISVHGVARCDNTLVVEVRAPLEYATRIAGIRVQNNEITQPLDHYVEHIKDDMIVCRCERVTAGEIRGLIQKGYRDINEIKIVTRAGMGACGSKTCSAIIHRLFIEEGINSNEIVEGTKRPLFMEVPLGIFAGEDQPGGKPV